MTVTRFLRVQSHRSSRFLWNPFGTLMMVMAKVPPKRSNTIETWMVMWPKKNWIYPAARCPSPWPPQRYSITRWNKNLRPHIPVTGNIHHALSPQGCNWKKIPIAATIIMVWMMLLCTPWPSSKLTAPLPRDRQIEYGQDKGNNNAQINYFHTIFLFLLTQKYTGIIPMLQKYYKLCYKPQTQKIRKVYLCM